MGLPSPQHTSASSMPPTANLPSTDGLLAGSSVGEAVAASSLAKVVPGCVGGCEPAHPAIIAVIARATVALDTTRIPGMVRLLEGGPGQYGFDCQALGGVNAEGVRDWFHLAPDLSSGAWGAPSPADAVSPYPSPYLGRRMYPTAVRFADRNQRGTCGSLHAESGMRYQALQRPESNAIFFRSGTTWVAIELVRLNDPAENRERLEALARIVVVRIAG